MRYMILAACITFVPATVHAEDLHQNAEDVVAAFEDLFGVTEGKRRNHTKGFCFTGTLRPNDHAIQNYSRSLLFKEASSVVGRVSHKGGNNEAADDKFGHYGLALEITAANGELHQMSMNTEHFFPVSTPEAFTQLMQAKAEGAEAVKAFAANSPELKAHKAYHAEIDKTLRPYEGATYNSINAFYLVDANDAKTAVRWSFVPAGESDIVLEPAQNFFFENMQANLEKGTVAWDMVVTLANQDDAIDNPAIQWVGDHTKLTAATLEVENVTREADGTCDQISFDPTALSDGFEPSEDRMLEARSVIYALTVGRRLSEESNND